MRDVALQSDRSSYEAMSSAQEGPDGGLNTKYPGTDGDR